MLNLRGIHHFALSVANLDESIQWYSQWLGFTLERRFGFAELQTEIAHLVSPGGIRLELLWQVGSHSSPDTGKDAFGAIATQGAKHIGLLVDNLDEVYQELKGHGATILHEPVTVEKAGVRNFWILDNSGNQLEINEQLSMTT